MTYGNKPGIYNVEQSDVVLLKWDGIADHKSQCPTVKGSDQTVIRLKVRQGELIGKAISELCAAACSLKPNDSGCE